MRMRGASTGSVVNAQTVTESVASNLSSWTMTTAVACPCIRCRLPRSRSRHGSRVGAAHRVDEGLIISGMVAVRDDGRLPMSFGSESWCAIIGDPQLDRAQSLFAQALPVGTNPIGTRWVVRCCHTRSVTCNAMAVNLAVLRMRSGIDRGASVVLYAWTSRLAPHTR